MCTHASHQAVRLLPLPPMTSWSIAAGDERTGERARPRVLSLRTVRCGGSKALGTDCTPPNASHIFATGMHSIERSPHKPATSWRLRLHSLQVTNYLARWPFSPVSPAPPARSNTPAMRALDVALPRRGHGAAPSSGGRARVFSVRAQQLQPGNGARQNTTQTKALSLWCAVQRAHNGGMRACGRLLGTLPHGAEGCAAMPSCIYFGGAGWIR